MAGHSILSYSYPLPSRSVVYSLTPRHPRLHRCDAAWSGPSLESSSTTARMSNPCVTEFAQPTHRSCSNQDSCAPQAPALRLEHLWNAAPQKPQGITLISRDLTILHTETLQLLETRLLGPALPSPHTETSQLFEIRLLRTALQHHALALAHLWDTAPQGTTHVFRDLIVLHTETAQLLETRLLGSALPSPPTETAGLPKIRRLRTALQYHALRLVDLHDAAHDALEHAQEGAIVRACHQGDVQGAEAAPPFPHVLQGPCAGEEVVAVHVEAHRHHPVPQGDVMWWVSVMKGRFSQLCLACFACVLSRD